MKENNDIRTLKARHAALNSEFDRLQSEYAFSGNKPPEERAALQNRLVELDQMGRDLGYLIRMYDPFSR